MLSFRLRPVIAVSFDLPKTESCACTNAMYVNEIAATESNAHYIVFTYDGGFIDFLPLQGRGSPDSNPLIYKRALTSTNLATTPQ